MLYRHELADINYKIRGGGFPLVHLHGYELDHRSLMYLMEPFYRKRGFMRIHFDLPGHGNSIAKTGLNNADDMISVISDFVESIIPGQAFGIVGLSYGGYLGRWFLEHQPSRVKAALFICPVVQPYFRDRQLPAFQIQQRDEAWFQTLKADEQDSIKDWMAIQTPYVYKHFLREIAPSFMLGQKDFLSRYGNKGYHFCKHIDSPDKNVSVSTVFLCGKQDNVVGYKDAIQLMDTYSHADLYILDGAGHYLPREQYRTFRLITQNWLSSLNQVFYSANSFARTITTSK